MNLSMAVGMKEDTVIKIIGAAIDTPLDMMVVPSSFSGDGVAANGTNASFSGPEKLEPGFVPEVEMGLAEEPFFEIEFPLWVVRIGFIAYLDMAKDGKPSGREEPIGNPFALAVDRVGMEAGIRKSRIAKVLQVNP